MAAKELPGGSMYHGSRPATSRSEPGTPNDPQELSNEGIPEVPSYPLAELPDSDYKTDALGKKK
jgi:hypothetical protein